MGHSRQQALIAAPLEDVWSLVGDPNRYPEWAADVVEVTGLPATVDGATYEQVTRTPSGKATTTFLVEELEALHAIRLRCTSSGYYAQWRLTEARGETFAEVEIGMEPTALRYRAANAMLVGTRWYHRIVEQSLDGLRTAVARRGGSG